MENNWIREHSGAIAWGVLASAISLYEATCPDGQLLSESVDRALERPVGRYLAIGAVAVTGAHLLNIFEHFGMEHLDPLHALGRLKRD